MERGNILSGAAFRSAFYGMIAMGLALFGLGVLSHFYITNTLEMDLRAQNASAIAPIQSVYESDGVEGLLETVDRLSPVFGRTHRLAVLYDDTGRKVAGVQDVAPDFMGWTTRDIPYPDSDVRSPEFF